MRDDKANRTKKISSVRDLEVYQLAFRTAMEIFVVSKEFPKEERYSLTDQIRRSSRSVCANLAEGWRKRRYKAVFMNKLSDSMQEAAETQTWLEFSLKCGNNKPVHGGINYYVDGEDSLLESSIVLFHRRPLNNRLFGLRGRNLPALR
jgi:four helix bundle protein